MAHGSTSPSHIAEQVLICRRDNPKAFWLAVKHGQFPASLNKFTQHVCIGLNAKARFLVSMFWRSNSLIVEQTKLALLTLAYAATENPTSIGPPHDVMTLGDDQQFRWSRHNSVSHLRDSFDEKMRAAFEELGSATADKLTPSG